MKTITKRVITKRSEGIYTITLNLIYTEMIDDVETEIINEDFSQTHNENNDISIAIGEIEKRIKDRISKYDSEQTFSGNLDSKIITLQESLNNKLK